MVGYRKPRGSPMDEKDLKSLIKIEIESSISWIGDELSSDREEAMEYYEGEPFGNEMEGRSQFVSTDVQDVVETMLPDLVEMFAAGDKILEFEPTEDTDVEPAKQATDYINFIWLVDNDGFGITHDVIKDALLLKNGFMRADWDETKTTKRETRTGLNYVDVQLLEQEPGVEIVSVETIPPKTREDALRADGAPLFNVEIDRKDTKGRVKIQAIPPDEMLIERRAASLKDANFTCHRSLKTISELREMGYDDDLLAKIPSPDDDLTNNERQQRFEDEPQSFGDEPSVDESRREVWLYDCFVKADVDGDGIAEMVNVRAAGGGYTLLPFPDEDEEIEEDESEDDEADDDAEESTSSSDVVEKRLAMEVESHPFYTITPIRMPHRIIGRSMHDLCREIQFIKSTIYRQILDNLYFINNARHAINERVDLDSYLTNKPGFPIMVDGPQSPGDSITPIPHTSIGTAAYPLLEIIEQVRQQRTGITPYSQGLDPDAMNKTFGGISMLLNQTQKRMLLIARVFAETGFKDVFRGILKLVIDHQDAPRMIRLRGAMPQRPAMSPEQKAEMEANETPEQKSRRLAEEAGFVWMDPRSWNAEMDLTPRVGLGYGTKESRAGALQQIMAYQMQAVQMQGGVQGPLITLKNLYEAGQELINVQGLKPASLYITDPNSIPPEKMQQIMAPKPSPEMQKVQAQIQADQAKLQATQQMDAVKLQSDQQRMAAELQMERERMQQEMALRREEMMGKFLLERSKALIEAGMEIEQTEIDAQLKREAAIFDSVMRASQQVADQQLQEARMAGDMAIKSRMAEQRPNGESRS